MRGRLRLLNVYAPYGVALACLVLIGWAGWRQVRHPEVGASWSFLSGKVDQVMSLGPAYGRLQPGDRVLALDGVPVQRALLFPDKQPGETVVLLLERGGETRSVVVRLVRPSLTVVLRRLAPLLLAMAFWTLAVIVLAFSPSDRQGVLFFLFCQASASMLASGAVSAVGPPWTARLFGFLLWWLGPLAIHFHLHFPKSVSSRYAPGLTALLYSAATLGALLNLVMDPLALRSALPWLYIAHRLWLAGGLLVVIFLLLRAYRRAVSAETRRQLGLVALGGGMALGLFLSLSLLPDALWQQPVVPYELSFLFLLALPLAYGYAILRYRLLRIERYVSHGAAYALVLALLGGLYISLQAVLVSLLPDALWQRPAASLASALPLAAAFGPIYRRLRMIVNRLFYGGWYDYRSAVQQISQMLVSAVDSASLAETLSQGIRKTMQLKCACLLLSDEKESLVCQSCAAHGLCLRRVSGREMLAQYFQHQPGVVETHALREAVEGRVLSDVEAQLLSCERARLWIPLRRHKHLLGVLILGPKRSREAFDARDLEILEVVIRQASIALENAHLVIKLRQRARESEWLHRQALRAREEERKRVARELHDQIIQALVGLNYGLSGLQSRASPEKNGRVAQLQTQVRHTLRDVRRICADLRPPALDSLGLVSAVRACLREVESQASFRVTLKIEGDREQELQEEIALCVYRVLQEALRNVQKHAQAQRVEVGLRISLEEVSLSVQDDGQGFVVPQRLGQLTKDGHFGLVGSRERLELVNGKLEVASIPGRGCRLEARVPLNAGTPTAAEPISREIIEQRGR